MFADLALLLASALDYAMAGDLAAEGMKIIWSEHKDTVTAQRDSHSILHRAMTSPKYQDSLRFIETLEKQKSLYHADDGKLGFEAYIRDEFARGQERGKFSPESTAMYNARDAVRKEVWDQVQTGIEARRVDPALLDPRSRHGYCMKARTLLDLFVPVDRAIYYGRGLQQQPWKKSGEAKFHESDNCPAVYKFLFDKCIKPLDGGSFDPERHGASD